jgi:hypothetical protein
MPDADRIETSSHGYKDGRPVVTLLTSSPNGIELLAARKIDVYATNLFEMLTYCRARA